MSADAKRARQEAILRLVGVRPIRTQGELTTELVRAGFTATQATVSRDIQELGLLRTRAGYKPGTFSEQIVSVSGVEFLTVVHTHPGGAGLVARAIDERDLAEVVGTVAGDDTIIAVHPDRQAAARFREFLGAQ